MSYEAGQVTVTYGGLQADEMYGFEIIVFTGSWKPVDRKCKWYMCGGTDTCVHCVEIIGVLVNMRGDNN